MLNDERLNAFVRILETRPGCSLLSLLFSIAMEVLTSVKGKKNKRHTDWNGSDTTSHK